MGHIRDGRQAIVTALQGLDGIYPVPYQPPASSWVQGTCWPVWDGMAAYDEQYRIDTAAVNSWRVIVIATGRGDADAGFDAVDDILASGILTALQTVGYVQLVAGAVITAEANTNGFYAAEITLRKES